MIALLALLIGADPKALGHDSYAVREAAHARLDYPLAALLLPASSPDAEINYRLRDLRARNLKWLRRGHAERVLIRRDPKAWVELALHRGRSVIAREWDTFELLHADYELATAVFARWPPQPGESRGFLWGSIYPGEFERWLAYLDYHAGVAPVPREK